MFPKGRIGFLNAFKICLDWLVPILEQLLVENGHAIFGPIFTRVHLTFFLEELGAKT